MRRLIRGAAFLFRDGYSASLGSIGPNAERRAASVLARASGAYVCDAVFRM